MLFKVLQINILASNKMFDLILTLCYSVFVILVSEYSICLNPGKNRPKKTEGQDFKQTSESTVEELPRLPNQCYSINTGNLDNKEIYFQFKYNLGIGATHSKFDLTRVRTHYPQIMDSTFHVPETLTLITEPASPGLA